MRLDLNLLITLDVLLKEKNVSRAARRLNLSQPSVSVQLAKLREYMNDPLLLPAARGMRPTARAEALQKPLEQALLALTQAVSPPDEFNPMNSSHEWRVMASDYSEMTILLPVLGALRRKAPGTRLAVFENVPEKISRLVEQGDIDLAFHTRNDAPPGLRSRKLFTERYVLACRAAHPLLTAAPSVEQFCSLEHVIVSPDGGGFYGETDRALAAIGTSRRVVLSVPHFMFLVPILMKTDLVAMLPSRLAADIPNLVTYEPPVEVPPMEMLMLWHERLHRDPAHQWLREFIAGVV
ncbi:LysR family transcriptional regulator [Leminorella grimontii]|uniref:LysR family transcriptional regulator n=2 Tax=Leminorella grimontii TaxID=82981 RepID=A0AAV5N4T9_9GAMM|nr:transcriptional regulator [Leminorella grimontii ATCC 33999 = DSM 5078]GKX56009.1 LysR family transcriptional regulator [Leminorella grimontii]GKX59058.1 LysR family transcriptional regulator [Leminorella grimontii]